jgi:signal peptidase I
LIENPALPPDNEETAASNRPRETSSSAISGPEPRGTAREWAGVLVIAFLLAMFVRTFIVQLYKIPSGSMSPTLIGDQIAREDRDGDGDEDLLIYKSATRRFQVFFKEGQDWIEQEEIFAGRVSANRLEVREDRILVNMFAYWFHSPVPGDLIVFNAPDQIWELDKAVFVKRAVATEGQTVEFRPTTAGERRSDRCRLAIDGGIVDQPAVFQKLRYSAMLGGGRFCGPAGEVDYAPGPRGYKFIRAVVPAGHVFALGDNTEYSYDSRYWGAVPVVNLKGRVVLRVWPPSEFGFLK